MSAAARSGKPEDHEFEALLDYLLHSHGVDFTGYKRPSLTRRVNYQMRGLGVESYADYISILEADPEEVPRLLNTILINVTAFFRDPAAWASLRKTAVPQIIAGKPPTDPIRVWSAGCASGEEPYTLAIVLAEALGREAFCDRVTIYATDRDEGALSCARQATYTEKEVAGVPPKLLDRYFEKTANRYIVNKDLRRAVIFGRHDLTQDVPISRLNLLVCRNTLMYFNADIQARVLARFHAALNDSGFLFLGQAEMIIARNSLFTPLDLARRIFSRAAEGSEYGSTRPFFIAPQPDDPVPGVAPG